MTLSLVGAVNAETTIHFSSSTHRIGLLELYTSQGCSSCPPRDVWVADLPKHGYTTDKVIPLAFHITYWDYLGWQDEFAQKAFDQRQRRLAVKSNSSVYTPQLLLSAKSMNNAQEFVTSLANINGQQAQLSLTSRLTISDDVVDIDTSIIHLAGQSLLPFKLFIALAENNLVTAVKAGENDGNTLVHQHVVRVLEGPINLADTTKQTTKIQIPLAETTPGNRTVVVFVQNPFDGAVLQVMQSPAF